jgi:hypothetical protein
MISNQDDVANQISERAPIHDQRDETEHKRACWNARNVASVLQREHRAGEQEEHTCPDHSDGAVIRTARDLEKARRSRRRCNSLMTFRSMAEINPDRCQKSG